jgi:hypothetical protein
MLDNLDSVPWASLTQPPWNTPTAVPDAIRRLAASTTDDDARAAYNGFLCSVGNNHAGTYFPVLLRALPFLEEILRSPLSRAHETTLDVLADLTGSFEPDPAHRMVTIESGAELALRDLVRAGVAGFSDIIGELARSVAPGIHTRRLAEEVLAALAEPAGL